MIEEEQDLDVQYLEPDESIPAPSENYTRIKLPFVGIYESVLDDTISNEIECDMEDTDENGNTFRYNKAKVDLKAIYRDIAEFTTDILGFKTAVYAGADSPQFYNYSDDDIYAWVANEELEELYQKYGVNNSDDLIVALADESDDLRVEERGQDILYDIAIAIFDEWLDNPSFRGYETISVNISWS